ncbi:salicylate hydroxylase [Coprinopsis marcescibilis]|uniref:Salicylate hydroxylase n=1 Tax=Coprinopsis marcescibilis TaxID=230819 RepID=A0A5C3L170_COPMA|nr:salicylate hydroxylase [Coprinopsis marcescibilis]
MASKDFSVVIIGGGMCGVACAVALHRAGMKVHLYEAAPKFEEVGAGVGLGPNAVQALEGLGILEDVVAKAVPPKLAMRPYTFISGYGEHEHLYDYALSSDELGLSIYRPVFLDALIPTIDPQYTHFNMRCTSVSLLPSGKQVVTFEDGTAVEADLVVGSDGIKSTIRPYVAGKSEHKQLASANTATYRALVSISELKKAGVKTDLTRPLLWCGSDSHMVTYPIRANELLNVGAVKVWGRTPSPPVTGPWVQTVTPEELLDEFADWGSDMKILLKHIKNPSKWFMHTVSPPLEHYVRDSVVLVGDAAHAMVPHLSAGVGQGFEDVYALYRLLIHPQTNASNLQKVLDVYDFLRPPRANMVAQRSRRMGEIYQSYGKDRYNRTDMQKNLRGMWEPVWHYDLKYAVSKELEKLYPGSKL